MLKFAARFEYFIIISIATYNYLPGVKVRQCQVTVWQIMFPIENSIVHSATARTTAYLFRSAYSI